MDKALRTVGIPGTDVAPWGTHFCHFYETKEGLTDLLASYFKTGLENNEFCLWVTSDLLDEKDARRAMIKAVPQFDRYVQDGQIEFVQPTEWYLKGGGFDVQRALQGWVKKLDQSLVKGYDGMRATGDVASIIASLKESDWRDFAEYEHMLDRAMKEHRMLVLCPYALDQCGASAIVDAVKYHQLVLIERMGAWERIESAELQRTRAELRELLTGA